MPAVLVPSSGRGRPWSVVATAWSVFKMYQSRRAYRHAVWSLSELDDYLLKDIGIGRSEIISAVYESRPSRGARR
jgi:uncharacterized protein YjiS (DUF1127 family)